MEVFRQQRAVRTFPDNSVSTNHFQEIDFGPKSYEQYPNSFDRLSYATKALAEARELQDIFTMLKPQDEERAAKIWRTGEFFTVSTSVIDLSAKTLYFARRLDEDYQRTPLPSSSPG